MIRRYLLIFTCCFPLLLIFCQTNKSISKDKFSSKKSKCSFYEFIHTNQLIIEEKSRGIAVPIEDLPCDCHVQGLGWAATNKQLVITCQDKCTEKEGAYILLFDEDKLLPLDIQKGTADIFYNHPSAIQISNGIFPVAFAAERNRDSFIEFYEIKEDQLKIKKEAGIHVKGRHIGALAYTNIDHQTYMIGVGWDAEDLTIWKAAGKNATMGFKQQFYTADATTMLKKRFRKNWGSYNSIWLGSLSDGRICLMGTHGKSSEKKSSLDIWEVLAIDSPQPKLSLMSAKKLKGKTNNGLNIFHEGVTVKSIGKDLEIVSIIAAPDDIMVVNCPSGYRCMNNIYEILTNNYR